MTTRDQFTMMRGMFWLCVTRLNDHVVETEKLVFKYEEGENYVFHEYGTDDRHTVSKSCFPFYQWKRGHHETMTSTYYARSRSHRATEGDVVFFGHVDYRGERKARSSTVTSASARTFKIKDSPVTFRKADGKAWGSRGYIGVSVFDVWTTHKMLKYGPFLIDRIEELTTN